MSEMATEAPQRLESDEVTRLRAEYNYLLDLAANDPSGSIEKFWTKLRKFIRDGSNGDPAAIKTWVDREIRKVEALAGLTGDQIDAALEDVQPDKAPDVARELDKVRLDVRQVAERLGVDASQIDFEAIVDEARRNLWDVQDIENRLRSDLQSQLESGANLMGNAGTFQTQLMEWARQNGLSIDDTTAAKYVMNMSLGIQSIEDAKQDLRESYLIGAYPAWEEKIRAGFDPWQISNPYRTAVANLLELDPNNIGLDEPLVKQGLQSIGADGKPRVMPLYEFEKIVRDDPRWQKTDNAYQLYTRAGTNLLQMFGFR
jgi:hypothetical protein